MRPPADLALALRDLLPDAGLRLTPLPGLDLSLWLLDPAALDRPRPPAEAARLLAAPLYWCYCWASGLALARLLATEPAWVRGKRVIDVGAGSGVAAIAAARAGAREVVACDLDPLALAACRANAARSGVELGLAADLRDEPDRYDLVLAADLLYDRRNLPLLDLLLARGRAALVADSRVPDFHHPRYRRLTTLEGATLPDLGEAAELRRVGLYHGQRAP